MQRIALQPFVVQWYNYSGPSIIEPAPMFVIDRAAQAVAAAEEHERLRREYSYDIDMIDPHVEPQVLRQGNHNMRI
jgi:hypothetical protein